MTRAQGWRFLDLGQRIERAAYLGTFLDAALHSPEADNPSVLEAVLEVADSAITYRSRYNLLPEMAAVFDLVLLDDTNPRSPCSNCCRWKALWPAAAGTGWALPSPAHRILIRSSRTRALDGSPTCTGPPPVPGMPRRQGKRCEKFGRIFPCFSDALSASYFAHSAISRAGSG